jgi:hypothetical protein
MIPDTFTQTSALFGLFVLTVGWGRSHASRRSALFRKADEARRYLMSRLICLDHRNRDRIQMDIAIKGLIRGWPWHPCYLNLVQITIRSTHERDLDSLQKLTTDLLASFLQATGRPTRTIFAVHTA